jgi:hypothetical protein
LSGCDITFWTQLENDQTICHCRLFSSAAAERKAASAAAEGSQADGGRRNGVARNGRSTESQQEAVALLSLGQSETSLDFQRDDYIIGRNGRFDFGNFVHGIASPKNISNERND